MPSAASQTVAVRANNIAFFCFGEDLLAALQGRSPRAEPELLGRGITMVEVHLMSGEATAAIGTGDFPKLAQEVSCRGLAASHALHFPRPIGRVIPHIRGSLIAWFGHDPL
jgi:hypothetical protein